MAIPVKIENDALAMEIWPLIGGKVSSIVDKADKFELLFNYPSEIPPASQYDRPYGMSWYAGWDECFPAVGGGPYVGHPYDGIGIPDHGELWGIPTTAVPTKNGITTVWHGLRFGYRLTRKLYLEDNSLIADYTLVNVAPFEFRFVWALHALMSMTSPAEIDLGESAPPFALLQDAEGKNVYQSFSWPTVESGCDLSSLRSLPAKRRWKSFSANPIEQRALVKYPERRRQLSIEYVSADVPAYWGIWINTGAWAGHHHFAIEPTTGRSDWIDAAVRDASAGRVAPLGRVDWQVRMTAAAITT